MNKKKKKTTLAYSSLEDQSVKAPAMQPGVGFRGSQAEGGMQVTDENSGCRTKVKSVASILPCSCPASRKWQGNSAAPGACLVWRATLAPSRQNGVTSPGRCLPSQLPSLLFCFPPFLTLLPAFIFCLIFVPWFSISPLAINIFPSVIFVDLFIYFQLLSPFRVLILPSLSLNLSFIFYSFSNSPSPTSSFSIYSCAS